MPQTQAVDPQAPADILPKRRRIDPWGLLSAALFIVGLLTFAGFLSRYSWVFDEASGLRLPYLELSLLAALGYAIGRRKRQCAAALALALVNALTILPLYLGGSPGTAKPTGRFLLANVHTENTDYDRLLDLIRTEDPDVVILEEVNDRWLAALGDLRKAYPHFIEEPDNSDNFGIALYTRWPVQNLQIKTLGEIQVPSVHAVLDLDGRRVHLIGTHPLPPGAGGYWHWRNNQFDELAKYIRTLNGPVALIGDLNVTPWSFYFDKLLRDSGLRDGGKGFGLHISWPAFFPPLGVPIDHCLVSPAISVVQRRTAPTIGSDHYPIVFDLAVTSP